jgi:ABC-type Fe3+/spermidine/putrescine transport system ATPase subunit
MIAGFESPTTGEILLNGQRIDHLPPYQRNVNTVFQNYALFPHLTVEGNIQFGLRRKHAENVAERVRGVLEQVRLSGKESRRPAELSGGERQRVALARALVLAPDVLLLDEPLSALDPQLRKQVRSELKELQRRVGVTFLFVTHDQEEALALSDSIAVMNRGAIEQVGSPREVYARPRTRFVASFLGAMNWIDGIGVRPEAVRLLRNLSGTTEPVAAGPPKVSGPGEGRSGPVPLACNPRGRKAVVAATVFLGPVMQVEARLEGGGVVMAQIGADAGAIQPGQTVYVSWTPTDEVRLPD